MSPKKIAQPDVEKIDDVQNPSPNFVSSSVLPVINWMQNTIAMMVRGLNPTEAVNLERRRFAIGAAVTFAAFTVGASLSKNAEASDKGEPGHPNNDINPNDRNEITNYINNLPRHEIELLNSYFSITSFLRSILRYLKHDHFNEANTFTR